MKIKSKRVLRLVVCLLLSTCVLACSFSVFAVDVFDRVNAYEYLWAYYIYQFLHSIGIDVTYQGLLEYTEEVQDTIIDWVVNYIADLIEADSQPSNYSIAQWVAPWQADYDYWGNLQFNSTMLEDMQDFAEWLKDELDLVPDSSVIIDPVYNVNGYELYLPNKWYRTVWTNGQASEELVSIRGNSATSGYLGYFVAINLNSESNPQAYFVYQNSISGTSNVINYMNMNGTVEGGSNSTGGDSTPNANGFYTVSGLNQFRPTPPDSVKGRIIPSGHNFYYSTSQELTNFLNNFNVVIEGDIGVVTYNIIMPNESPDYTPGDGVTIIDGVPNYEVVNIDHVSVDNLPAVIQPTKVENPEIDQFYDFIPSFIQEAGDSMTFFKQIIFRMPDEVLLCIYAVLASGVIFGFLRILREH